MLPEFRDLPIVPADRPAPIPWFTVHAFDGRTGAAFSVTLQASGEYAALLTATTGRPYTEAEVCDASGRQLAVYDAPQPPDVPPVRCADCQFDRCDRHAPGAERALEGPEALNR